MREVLLLSRRLKTVASDDPIWKHWDVVGFDNAIVRICPPADVDAESVAVLTYKIRAVAAAVKVMAPLSDAMVVMPSASSVGAAVQTTREVVEQMVRDARTADRELLGSVVDEALSAVGL